MLVTFSLCAEPWEKGTGQKHTSMAHFLFVLHGVRDLENASKQHSFPEMGDLGGRPDT